MDSGSSPANTQPTFISPQLEAPGRIHNAPVVIMVPAASSPVKTDYSKIFPQTVVVLLGVFQLIMGFFAMTTQIVCLAQGRNYYNYGFAAIGNGIWCGIIFMLSGGFSIWAGRRPSKCTIITQMVFSIIAACFCLPAVVLTGIGVGIHANGYRGYSNSSSREVLVAMYSIQLMVSLAQAAIAIAASALACKAICCNFERKGAVYYTAQGIDNATANNFVSYGQAPSGYITVPISSNAMTSIPMTEPANMPSNTQSEDVSANETPPPKYEDTANNAYVSTKDDSRANDMKYNRLT